MISVDRHTSLLYKYGHLLLVVTVVLSLGFWLCAARLFTTKGHVVTHSIAGFSWADTPEKQESSHVDWTILTHGNVIVAQNNSAGISTMFRLAGTFFAFSEGVKGARKAVLENLETGADVIVSEQDVVCGYSILKIHQDRVVLLGTAGEEELWLSFSSGKSNKSEGVGLASISPDAKVVIGNKLFGGKQVGKNNWVFQRKKLMEYYQELMDDPTRLYNVFQSLKPIYGDHDQITGYQLGIEGENDFFDAVGLGQGDIVRKVNSVPMTDRRRAEHFIGQFAKDRANAFLVDIERDGQPIRLSYKIR